MGNGEHEKIQKQNLICYCLLLLRRRADTWTNKAVRYNEREQNYWNQIKTLEKRHIQRGKQKDNIFKNYSYAFIIIIKSLRHRHNYAKRLEENIFCCFVLMKKRFAALIRPSESNICQETHNLKLCNFSSVLFTLFSSSTQRAWLYYKPTHELIYIWAATT